jgi:hypothetical protein
MMQHGNMNVKFGTMQHGNMNVKFGTMQHGNMNVKCGPMLYRTQSFMDPNRNPEDFAGT